MATQGQEPDFFAFDTTKDLTGQLWNKFNDILRAPNANQNNNLESWFIKLRDSVVTAFQGANFQNLSDYQRVVASVPDYRDVIENSNDANAIADAVYNILLSEGYGAGGVQERPILSRENQDSLELAAEKLKPSLPMTRTLQTAPSNSPTSPASQLPTSGTTSQPPVSTGPVFAPPPVTGAPTAPSTNGTQLKPNLLASTPAQWASNEKQIEDAMKEFLRTSKWERVQDHTQLKPGSGVVADPCAILNQFNISCANISCNGSDATGCRTLLNRLSAAYAANKDKAFDIAEVTKNIQKLDPGIAYNTLSGFGFGYYKSVFTEPPLAGLTRYRVQPAKDWFRELQSGVKSPSCVWALGSSPHSAPCPVLRDRLRVLTNGGPLFGELSRYLKSSNPGEIWALQTLVSYLEILAAWVDANPTILNKELITNPQFQQAATNMPKPSDAYTIYKWVPDANTVKIQAHYGNICNLDRLKAHITSNTASNFTTNNIIGTPSNMSNLFNVGTFTQYLNAMRHPIGFTGGSGVSGITQGLQALNLQAHYGTHELFANMYEQVFKSMESAGGLQISQNAKQSIEGKIAKFKSEEEELVKELKDFHDKVQYYYASRGHIDPFSHTPQEWEAIKQKHANLIRRTSALNQRAINIIDIMQALNKATLDRLTGQSGAPASQFQYPLRHDIHYP